MEAFRKLLYIVCTVLLSLGAASYTFAQSVGSIRGTVTDQTGGVIAKATVMATETSTNISRSAATNETGIFVFPDLPIGNYTLKISAAGFKTENRPALQLITGQVMDLTIGMTVGSQTQEVTVTSDTQQIQTATSSVAQSVTEQQMRDLPLNGRNPLQLTALTAGAVLNTTGTEVGQQDNTGLMVNGLRTQENTFTLDGTIYVNRFEDSPPTMPNPDALQEFTVQASNYSADHGGAGALVQLSTRSGTDTLHGSAWEYFRNTVLDSKNYFQTVIPPYKLNQFGGTAGGPVFKSKKAFFFFSSEDLQQRSSPNPVAILLPTAAELTGDFSALLRQSTPVTIYSPATGCAYGQTGTLATGCSGSATDIISTPMDPLSSAVNKQYLAAVEARALPAANNTYSTFSSTSNSNIDSTQYLVRLDQAIGQNDHLSGRYFYNENNFQRAFNAPLGFFGENLFRNQTLTISDAHVFSSKLTSAVYASFYRGARTQIPEAPGLKTLKDLGQTINYGSPNESLVPFPGVRSNLSGFVNIFSGGALSQDATTFDFTGQVVKLLHNHTLTMGGDMERDRVDMDDYSYTPGDNTFNGQRTQAPTGSTTNTGSVLADFYTGYPIVFYEDNGRKAYIREIRPSLFLQDDWKLNSKLTLNLGLRWDPWVPAIDNNSTLVGFNLANPSFQSTVAPGAPKGLMFNGDPGVASSIYHRALKDFGPRVGFAYNVFGNGKTVVRGGYGIFYGIPPAGQYQRTDAMQPIDLYLQISAPPQWDNVYTNFAGGDPFPRGHVGPSQFSTYTFLLPVAGGVLGPQSKEEYTQGYNMTVEQDLSHSFAMSVAYVGNHAEHIMGMRAFNPAVYTANAGDTTGNENSRTLHPGLSTQIWLDDSYEYEMTNSLQFNVTRRASHGLTLLSNVVWMKTIDNNSSGGDLNQAGSTNPGPPNPFNLQSGRGVADFDQAVRFTASVNYLVPKLHVNQMAGQIVNGWQLNGILTSQSGLPINIISGVDNSLSGVGGDQADYVSGINPARPAGSPKTVWFNKAAFQKNAVGTFGNVPRNTLRGPSYNDLDMSLFKDILPERRVHGQFQAEVFNSLNHTNLGNPVASVSSGTFGQVTATNTSSGTVDMTAPIGSARIWQFVGKIIF